MSRSIFDPTGGETEHSGSRNMGPRADNISHLPPDIAEAKVDDSDEVEVEKDLTDAAIEARKRDAAT